MTRRQPDLKRFQARGNNLLLSLQQPTAINQVWVGDVTYLKIKGRWPYLATVMDQYSRRIIGWSLSSSRTTALTCNAIGYALKKRAPTVGLIFHTDRGIEYTGNRFQRTLADHGIRHSVNRPATCTDNAHMESFFHSLKAERIRGTLFTSVKELRRSLSIDINRFYNAVRLHSGISYASPVKYVLGAAH